MPANANESIVRWIGTGGTGTDGGTAPEVNATLRSTIAGEDVDNNRLITYELWDYENNLTASGVVKSGPAILGVAQVIVAGGTNVTFWDSASGPSGTKLGILDTTAPVGTQIRFGRTAINGIYAQFNGGAGAEIAVGTL